MSHICEPAFLMQNYLTKWEEIDITLNSFIMIIYYLENKSWMLLSPMTTRTRKTNFDQLIGLMQSHTYNPKNNIMSKECYKMELAACYVARCLERS